MYVSLGNTTLSNPSAHQHQTLSVYFWFCISCRWWMPQLIFDRRDFPYSELLLSYPTELDDHLRLINWRKKKWKGRMCNDATAWKRELNPSSTTLWSTMRELGSLRSIHSEIMMKHQTQLFWYLEWAIFMQRRQRRLMKYGSYLLQSISLWSKSNLELQASLLNASSAPSVIIRTSAIHAVSV